MADSPHPTNTSSEEASQQHMRSVPEGPPRGVPEMRQPPVRRPQDIDLRTQVHTIHIQGEDADSEEEIDMHPLTSALVPSQAPYMPPLPLRGPNHAQQGLPPGPPGLTLEEMEPRFKFRVPLRLATGNNN